MKNVLVMTATISPKSGAFSLARTDPALRLRDYMQGLSHYLPSLKRNTFDALVFAENSNSDLEPLRALARGAGLADRVEFMSLYGLDYPQEYSRGYGEFLLLDRVMESSFWKDADPGAVVWKVTGRYRVRNVDAIVRDQPASFDLYCHCRNYPTRLVDQYMMAWRLGAYGRSFKGIYERFKESETKKYGEQVMRELIDSGDLGAMSVIRRFKHVPDVAGVRGWDNREYANGLKNHAKLLARKVSNRLLPWLWI